MRKWFAIFLVYISAGLMAQAPADSLISSGNSEYNQGNYDQAIADYEQVIDGGMSSAELYYNLGNAYFKSDDIPAAILYYEKAKKLKPNDEDINFNLRLANSRIIDKIEPLPEFFLKQWFRQLRNLQTPDKWARLGVTLFMAFLALALVFLLSNRIIIRKISFWTGILVLIVSLSGFALGFQGYHFYKNRQEGIIFTPTVTVKSSPNDNSVDLFVIHEGTKVSVTDQLEDWSEIRIANGSVGWIKDSTYRTI